MRDLFLSDDAAPLTLPDVDLVVDSAYQTLEMGAGVVLAEAIKAQHPEAELQVYGRFQTAALVWHEAPTSPAKSLMVDIATARTEFYPYPAANPEVEASSIRQDLYRRDFTINALAICLTPPQAGQLLDFFWRSGRFTGSADSGAARQQLYRRPHADLSGGALCGAVAVHPRTPDRRLYPPRDRERHLQAAANRNRQAARASNSPQSRTAIHPGGRLLGKRPGVT